MTVVDVIDLTISSPTPSVILIGDDTKTRAAVSSYENEDSKEKRKRKKHKKDERRRHEPREDRRHDDLWRHDKYLDEDYHHYSREGKTDDANVPRRPKRRDRSPTLPPFFIDTTRSETAIPIPPATESIVVDVAFEPPAERGLLLPAHVTLSAQDSAPLVNDNPPLSPISEASGIDFLDEDCAVGAPRYFEDMVMTSKPSRSRGPCKRCGDADHDIRNCTNMICLTCGARNEHGSRSCPVLRFCWNCKAKGHISRDCPRIGDMDQRRLNREDCERCGSWKHHGTNCPTLWRVYTYLADGERDAVLVDRESKRLLGFENGGEGYIARDRWCYNCGGSGHLGDDCEAVAPNHDKPNEYSAFGSFNELTGPFASLSSAVPNFERTPREWEEGTRFDDGYGFSAENHVGKKSRENAKAKAREAQRLLDEDDSEPDWFSMNRSASGGERVKVTTPSSTGKSGLPSKPVQPTIRLGSRKSGTSGVPLDSAPSSGSRLSLRDRIDKGGKRASDHSQRDHGERHGDRREPRNKSNGSMRDYRSRDEPRREGGSRWRGGYDR